MLNSPILIIGLVAIIVLFIELLFFLIIKGNKEKHPLKNLIIKATPEENRALYNNTLNAERIGIIKATEILLKEAKYWFGDLVEYPQFEKASIKSIRELKKCLKHDLNEEVKK